MYAPGASMPRSRPGRQGVYAKIKLIDHLPKKYTCILFDRRECGKSGGRVGARDLAALRRARGCSIISLHRTGAPHGRLHGLLPGGGVRRGAPAGDAEHGALLAGGRRQVPHQQPPALRRASRLRATARPRRGGRARRQGGRSAPIPEAAVGIGDQGRSRLHRDLRASRTSTPTTPAWRAACSTATRRPAPSPRTCSASTSRPSSCPAATRATSAARYLEECLPRSEYWDVPVAEQTETTVAARG